MGLVAQLGCAVCERMGYADSPAMVHHPRTGVGMGKKAPDSETIPLCHRHHQGEDGVHTLGRKAWERRFGLTELELVAETKQRVAALQARQIRGIH